MEEIMRRVLPVLLSLCFLVEVTKGGVVLCRHSPKSNARNEANAHYTPDTTPFGAVRKEDENDYFYDDPYRKESVRNKRLGAMLMKDSDDANYRADNKRNNYSALEGSLRADMLRAYANRDNDGSNRRIRSKRHIKFEDNANGKNFNDY